MSDSIASAAWQKPRPRLRRATTLIEVIGTLSVLLVIAVSAAGILGAVTEIGARAGNAKKGRAAVQRLADAIRRDVHDADSVSSSDAWPLELIIGSVAIQYEWNDQTRSVRRTVKDGKTQRAIDRFPLPDHCDPRVSASDEMVTVVLREAGPSHRPWIIEASHQ